MHTGPHLNPQDHACLCDRPSLFRGVRVAESLWQ